MSYFDFQRCDIDVGGSSQAAVLLARRGQISVTDPNYAVLPLIYHLAFHSLGSRLFAIRERTGLFYGATGKLAHNASLTQPGMDLVATKVDPANCDKAIHEIQQMLHTLATNPQVSQQELDAAKMWHEHKLINILNSPSEFTDMIIQLKTLYPHQDYHTILTDKITKIHNTDLQQINSLCKTLFKVPYDTVIVAH